MHTCTSCSQATRFTVSTPAGWVLRCYRWSEPRGPDRNGLSGTTAETTDQATDAWEEAGALMEATLIEVGLQWMSYGWPKPQPCSAEAPPRPELVQPGLAVILGADWYPGGFVLFSKFAGRWLIAPQQLVAGVDVDVRLLIMPTYCHVRKRYLLLCKLLIPQSWPHAWFFKSKFSTLGCSVSSYIVHWLYLSRLQDVCSLWGQLPVWNGVFGISRPKCWLFVYSNASCCMCSTTPVRKLNVCRGDSVITLGSHGSTRSFEMPTFTFMC